MKNPKYFQLFLFFSIIFFLTTRLYAVQGNNFHFTVDQGRDAVYVRDIIKNHTLFTNGPETSIRGIFTGPLWYYLLVPGYILTAGHPIAAPLTLVVLNLFTLVYLAYWLRKHINTTTSILATTTLLVFWPFFETSLYGFNPFPAVALAIFQITLLTQRKHLLSFIPIALSLNTNLAIAAVFLIFQATAIITKPKSFVHHTLLLALISYIFFAISPVYRPWYTVYLAPLMLISLIIILTKFKYYLLVLITFLLLIVNFSSRYTTYLNPSPDPSLLYNQLATVDWLYQSAKNQGFAVYNYTDTFYDHSYQYLFYWHGLNSYNYLPCEYSNFPLAPKELYVPNFQSYLEPKRHCDQQKFLVIQNDTNGQDNSDWINTFRNNHNLVDQAQIGAITIEMHEVTPDTPTDFCLWWHRCD